MKSEGTIQAKIRRHMRLRKLTGDSPLPRDRSPAELPTYLRPPSLKCLPLPNHHRVRPRQPLPSLLQPPDALRCCVKSKDIAGCAQKYLGRCSENHRSLHPDEQACREGSLDLLNLRRECRRRDVRPLCGSWNAAPRQGLQNTGSAVVPSGPHD